MCINIRSVVLQTARSAVDVALNLTREGAQRLRLFSWEGSEMSAMTEVSKSLSKQAGLLLNPL